MDAAPMEVTEQAEPGPACKQDAHEEKRTSLRDALRQPLPPPKHSEKKRNVGRDER